jgi:hypothetical protein
MWMGVMPSDEVRRDLPLIHVVDTICRKFSMGFRGRVKRLDGCAALS